MKYTEIQGFIRKQTLFTFIPISPCILLSVFKVACYVFDSDGKKHDLNPLIKLKDGYLVDDPDDDVDFYINICRSLSRFL